MKCTFCRSEDIYVFGCWALCPDCAKRGDVILRQERGEWLAYLTVGNQEVYAYTSERQHRATLDVHKKSLSLIAGAA